VYSTIHLATLTRRQSWFFCIFGKEGVSKECEREGVEMLGDVPLDGRICEDADRGKPTVVSEPEGDRAAAYLGIARRVAELVELEVR